MPPTISNRQRTLSTLLSGDGLASGDKAAWRKICIALAEDAELREQAESAESLLAAGGPVRTSRARQAGNLFG